MTYTFTIEITNRDTEGLTETDMEHHIRDILDIYSKFDILSVDFLATNI